MSTDTAVISVALILIANMATLGCNLKLYTEILKDSAFNQRAKNKLPEES